jgi:hypothetical protein
VSAVSARRHGRCGALFTLRDRRITQASQSLLGLFPQLRMESARGSMTAILNTRAIPDNRSMP